MVWYAWKSGWKISEGGWGVHPVSTSKGQHVKVIQLFCLVIPTVLSPYCWCVFPIAIVVSRRALIRKVILKSPSFTLVSLQSWDKTDMHRNWQDEHPSWCQPVASPFTPFLLTILFEAGRCSGEFSHFSSLYVETFSLKFVALPHFIKIIFPRQQQDHLMVEIQVMIRDSWQGTQSLQFFTFWFPFGCWF